MTTIAYRDGIVAADTRSYSGSNTPCGYRSKIAFTSAGDVVGATSSSPGVCDAFMKWIEAGADQEKFFKMHPDDGFHGIHILKTGEVFMYMGCELPHGPLRDEYFAIGSGEKYAYGAMAVGASAKEAVEAAIKHEIFTDGEVEFLAFS